MSVSKSGEMSVYRDLSLRNSSLKQWTPERALTLPVQGADVSFLDVQFCSSFPGANGKSLSELLLCASRMHGDCLKTLPADEQVADQSGEPRSF